MNLNSKHLIEHLEEHGFVYKRSKGGHQLYYHPITHKTVIIPVHGGKDLKRGTLLAILKQAGIKNKNLSNKSINQLID